MLFSKIYKNIGALGDGQNKTKHQPCHNQILDELSHVVPK